MEMINRRPFFPHQAEVPDTIGPAFDPPHMHPKTIEEEAGRKWWLIINKIFNFSPFGRSAESRQFLIFNQLSN